MGAGKAHVIFLMAEDKRQAAMVRGPIMINA